MLFCVQTSLANGRAALRGLFAQRFVGGGVHCSSDLLALGVMIEARAQGLDVPGQIAVIGFGDQEFSASVEPDITTLRVDMAAFGRAAAQAMRARLQGDRGGPSVIDLGFEIVQRRSA